MRLSLNILKDYLDKSNLPATIVRNTKREFLGIRLYLRQRALSPDFLYCCAALPDAEDANLPAMNLVVTDGRGKGALPGCNSLLSCEAGEMAELFSKLQDCFLFYEQWQTSVNDALFNGGTLQELIELSLPLFNNPIIVDDPSFRTLAISCGKENSLPADDETTFILTNGYHSPQYVGFVTDSPVFTANIIRNKEAFIHKYAFLEHESIYCGIRRKDKIEGFLTIVGQNKNFTPGMLEMANRFSAVLSKAMQGPAGSFSQKKRLEDSAFLDQLKGKEMDPRVFDVFFRKSGLIEAHIHYVACITTKRRRKSDQFMLMRVADLLEERMQYSKILTDSEEIILIADEQDLVREELMTVWKEFVQLNQIVIGFSLLFRGFQNLSVYYRQAQSSVRYGKYSDQDPAGHVYEHMILWDVLARAIRPEESVAYCHPAISILEEYDKEKATSLAETLRLLARNDFNSIATAKQMHLHKNSLYYRMNQITDLTGLRLDDLDKREHLRISYCLRDLYGE